MHNKSSKVDSFDFLRDFISLVNPLLCLSCVPQGVPEGVLSSVFLPKTRSSPKPYLDPPLKSYKIDEIAKIWMNEYKNEWNFHIFTHMWLWIITKLACLFRICKRKKRNKRKKKKKKKMRLPTAMGENRFELLSLGTRPCTVLRDAFKAVMSSSGHI